MPVDDAFARTDLAGLYDALNPAGADTQFYLALPQRPSVIVDIGCGTGLLTRSYAEAGHDVTGIEPAQGMLAVARRNDPDGTVAWISATGADFRVDRRFDLAVMTGHVFQVFRDDAGTLAVLKNIRRHLKEGGRLVFDSRNPTAMAWTGWTEALTRRRILAGDTGAVDVHHQLLSVEGEFVTFESVFDFAATGQRETSRSSLRFTSHKTIATLLAEAGFAVIDWIGDWDGSAWRQKSREIIAIAHNGGRPEPGQGVVTPAV